jgi:RNase H-fold protein (predicted Holliday junction resolvase)
MLNSSKSLARLRGLVADGKRVLGLDVGTRFVGVSLSQEFTRGPASGLTVLERVVPNTFSSPSSSSSSSPRFLQVKIVPFTDSVRALVRVHDVAGIVVGLPRSPAVADADNPMITEIKSFVYDMEHWGGLSTPVFWQNEALSTQHALHSATQHLKDSVRVSAPGMTKESKGAKKKKQVKVSKKKLDMGSACVILDDFVAANDISPTKPFSY